ncbi:MAG: transglycosylase SLT domain-containing protein [Flavobacteriales bacterium]|nr:transglycosylase SLT domain-containing protein [Flavobacteriales bacterium]MCB9166283.1 transglycosylase SLT domain-containing protein [Flavobacteriales bacterium]
MNRRSRLVIVLAVVLATALAYLAFGPDGPVVEGRRWDRPSVDRDLTEVIADTFRVLVVQDPLCYEQWPEAEHGAVYEMLERFAEQQGLVIAPRLAPVDSLVPLLQSGRGDVIAAPIPARSPLLTYVHASRPYWHLAPMVALLRADRLLGLQEADIPDTIRSSRSSVFAQAPEPSVGASTLVLTDRSTQELIEELAIGRGRAVLLTDAEARYYAGLFPQLTFRETGAPRLACVFGSRTNARALAKELDRWIGSDEEARGMILAAYGGPIRTRKALGRSIGRPVVVGDTISPYDSLFRHFSTRHGIPWELLAAIAFKESGFDSAAVSHRGARGLMQLMPRTARGLGVDSLHLVDAQVRAGAMFLAVLDSIWMRSVPDDEQRLPFVLAAYNAGPGHVLDAQRLAGELGLDRRRWMGNVERAITLLALPDQFTRPGIGNGRCKGNETFLYVRDVLGIYARFRSVSTAP